MDAELKAVLTEFKDEIRGDIGALRGEIKHVEKRLSDRIDSVETALSGRIDSVETTLGDRIDSVETTLGDRIDSVETRLDRVESEVIKNGEEIHEIHLILENDIKHKIALVADGFQLLEERMNREAGEEEQYRRNVDLRIASLVNQT